MKKKIIRSCVFQIPAGEAKPGQKIASFGIPNMSKFCLEVNKLAVDYKHEKGKIVRIKVDIDEKKNWRVKILSTPTTLLFKELLNEAGEKSFLNLSKQKQDEIIDKLAEVKLADLNTEDSQKARKVIAGSLRSFGIKL